MLKKIFFALLLLTFFSISISRSIAQTDTPSPTPTPDPSQQTSSIQECANAGKTVAQCPDYLQSKLNDLAGQEQTLNSQIAVMNGQINLTQARIYATEQQISTLTLNIDTASQKITSMQASVDNLTKVLLNRVVATYEVGSIQPLQVLLTSSDVTNFLKKLNYLKIAQANDKKVLYDTVQAKNDYQNQKNIYEDQKKQVEALKTQLDAYSQQLDQQKQAKQQLLQQTQGDEATYERLLSEARAQLAGFKNFVAAQGGASILSNQTVCDGWGCYYNQRDSQWGNIGINGTSTTIAEAGCLMTSVAMVYTHYGHHVTPLDVNIGSNFFSSTAYLLKTISVAGVSSSRISSSIDATLSGGDPVIVGISYDGGPIADHFVVLISGSGGNYQMNDPFVPNGHNISFVSHYSLGSIVEIERVSF